MKSFKDREGREWLIDINVGAIKRVKSLLGLDLLDLENGKVIERLVSDPVQLVDVLYVLCQAQAGERGVSDEQFGRSMAGDAIDHAVTALLEEYVDFFPQAKRLVLQKALRTLKQIEARVIAAADQTISALDEPAIERAVESIFRGGRSSGATPPSAASIPAA